MVMMLGYEVDSSWEEGGQFRGVGDFSATSNNQGLQRMSSWQLSWREPGQNGPDDCPRRRRSGSNVLLPTDPTRRSHGRQPNAAAKVEDIVGDQAQPGSSSAFPDSPCSDETDKSTPHPASSAPAVVSTPASPMSLEGRRSLELPAVEITERPRIRRDGNQGSEEAVSVYQSLSTGISLDELPGAPDPLTFLETDSPPVTEESIRQAIAEASENWSPRTVSSFGSTGSNEASDIETSITTATTTPEHSVCGEEAVLPGVTKPLQPHPGNAPPGSFQGRRELHARRPPLHPSLNEAVQGHQYGTPEMARGSAKHPHLPPSELQPRLVTPGQGYPKHLPRAEKLPMSGYELLAAKLSTSAPWATRRGSSSSLRSDDEPAIKPIYRRFEALNHRLLLHLQDELTELEEQLHRLDTADTQTRRLQNCILPASRRAEAMAGGELQWRKTDVLGKIGFKLAQFSWSSPHLMRMAC